jgi:hypothetical protein
MAVTSTSATISWPANTETDLASYTVERSTGVGNTTYTALATGVTETSYLDSGLTSGTTYNYRIRAVDTSGNTSTPSQILSIVPITTPAVPTGLAVTTPAPRTASLSWNAVAGAPAYSVYRDDVLIKSGVPGTSYSDTAEPGDYVYKVAAGIAPNLSAPSAGVAAQVYGITVLPGSVSIPPAKQGTTAPILYQFQIVGRGTFANSDDQPWLVVSPSSGTLSDTPTTITLTADPTGEPVGTYQATVSFTEGPAAQAPINTAIPTVSGSTVSGQTLTGNVGSFSGTPTSYSKKFYRNSGTGGAWVQVGSTASSSATSSTYALTSGDIGFQIRYGVVATNAQGSSVEVFSAASAVVTAAPTAPVNSTLPAVTGSTQQGSALTGTMGTWTQTPTSYAYQWQKETSAGSGTYTNIVGASGTSTGAAASYTSVTGDVGLKIRIQVTATNGVGTSSASNSTAVGPITSSAPSLVLARYALNLNGTTSKIILTPSSYDGTEPLTMGALVYLIPISGRTVRYNPIGLPSAADNTAPARSITYDPANGAGWWDVALGPHGQSGMPSGKWVWLVAARNNDSTGQIRAEFCDMTTGVWSTLYQAGNTAWPVSAASGSIIVIGGISRTNVAAGWAGYWLAGFKANIYYTDAQIRATVSSGGGGFYIDPAVLQAAPSVESVWRADDPSNPISDLVGTANETSRSNITVYDAGAATLPLKVS